MIDQIIAAIGEDNIESTAEVEKVRRDYNKSIKMVSDSLTGLTDAFYDILASRTNVANINRAVLKARESQSRENMLESGTLASIVAQPQPVSQETTFNFDDLTSAINELNAAIDQYGLGGDDGFGIDDVAEGGRGRRGRQGRRSRRLGNTVKIASGVAVVGGLGLAATQAKASPSLNTDIAGSTGTPSGSIGRPGPSQPLTVSSGVGAGGGEYIAASGGTGAWAKDTAFIGRVNSLSRRYSIDANDLLGLMQSESGINPQAINPKGGATGLIQFMPRTARELGTTTDALYNMNRVQQMTWVERFFEYVKLPRGAGPGHLYTSVFLPAYANKPSNFVVARQGAANDAGANKSGSWYAANKGLDGNRDGQITIAELGARVSRKRQEIGLGPSRSQGGGSYAQAATPTGSAALGGGGGGGGGADGTRLVGSGAFIRPVANERITSRFGPRKRPTAGASTNHKGVDFGPVKAGTKGDPIYASAEGTVTFAGNAGSYGLVIYVDHADGYQTRYAHLDRILVRNGQRVTQGQQIGQLGNTGVGTGPHLHFEIREGGRPINPLSLLSGVTVAPDPNATEPANVDSGRNTSSTIDTGSLRPESTLSSQVAAPAAEIAIQKKAQEEGEKPTVVPIIIGGQPQNPADYLGAVKPKRDAKPRGRNPAREYKLYFAA